MTAFTSETAVLASSCREILVSGQRSFTPEAVFGNPLQTKLGPWRNKLCLSSEKGRRAVNTHMVRAQASLEHQLLRLCSCTRNSPKKCAEIVSHRFHSACEPPRATGGSLRLILSILFHDARFFKGQLILLSFPPKRAARCVSAPRQTTDSARPIPTNGGVAVV